MYLPDRFKATTTELEDGTIVMLESEADREAQEQQQRMIIEVKQTEAETDGETYKQTTQDKAEIVEQLRAQIAGTSSGVEHPDPDAQTEKPISRAERRRLIKQEIQRLSQGETPVYYQRRLW